MVSFPLLVFMVMLLPLTAVTVLGVGIHKGVYLDLCLAVLVTRTFWPT